MNTAIETSVKDDGPPRSRGAEGSDEVARERSCCVPIKGTESKPREMCPMAGMCAGMMKPGAWSRWLSLVPGALLVAGGLLVILVPEILAWLLGGAAMFIGLMFLMMAHWMRRFANRLASHGTDARVEPAP
jgi:hypothetical protein